MKLIELPYRKTPAELFQHVAAEPWSMFLDSGHPYIDSGRYDIFSARPRMTLVTTDGETLITDGHSQTRSSDDPFALLRQALGMRAENRSGIPFCGGALGYFAYELGRRIEQLPRIAARDLAIPDMAIGIYDWAVVMDHHRRQGWLVGEARGAMTDARWNNLERLFRAPSQTRLPRFVIESDLRCNMTREQYQQSFQRIKNYIREGDCYQVNLAQRFDVDVAGEAWDLYLQLRRANPAPFGAFMRLPEAAILSCSPERFLSVIDGQVETKPIKGTIRRSVFAYEDKALAAQLLESEKDRAENLMIVDLLRNDLGKNCRTGSVAVPRLFALETFATVHHLVSTVTGRLADGRDTLSLLRGCFPGGSITGAPKLRAMQIIDELEPSCRNVYCGSMARIGFDGNMDSNIAIRTAVYERGRLCYWAGGGIVADSEPEAEYQESLIKAESFLRLFNRQQARDVGR